VRVFLGRRKVIPKPFEVVNNRPLTSSAFDYIGIDINPPVYFRVDNEFINTWKGKNQQFIPQEGTDQYILNVLELARDFFQYFSSSNFRGVILKTFDVVQSKVEARRRRVKVTRFSTGDADWENRINLIQPLAPCHRFPIVQETFERVVQPLMKTSLNKISLFKK